MADKRKQNSADHLVSSITQHIQELAEATDLAHLNEQMRAYLDMCATFHQYSPNNIWLIKMACPHASMVAGFHKWKELGRYVKRGEKGISILAPILVKEKDCHKDDPRKLVGFKIVYVQ